MTDHTTWQTDHVSYRRKLNLQPGVGGGGFGFNLAEQVSAMGKAEFERADAARYGEIVPPPILTWMCEYGDFRRFIQYIWVTLPTAIDTGQLQTVLQAVLDNHDMLRAQLEPIDGGHRLTTRPPGTVRAQDILIHIPVAADDAAVSTHVSSVIDTIDPCTGAMFRALWCEDPDTDNGGRLLLVAHHVAMDVVSWYVLGAGVADAWEQITNHREGTPRRIDLRGERTPYRRWAELMEQRSHRPEVGAQRDYWLAQLTGPDPELGSRLPDPRRDTWASLRGTEAVTRVNETRLLLDKVASAGPDIGVREFLLTALTVTVASWRQRRGNAPDPAEEGLQLHLEGHGRGDALIDAGSPKPSDDVDTSATVGWFTQIFPVFLRAGRAVDVDTVRREPDAARELLRTVTATVATVPNHGLDYGLLRYKRRDPDLLAARDPQVLFNYIGRFDLQTSPNGTNRAADPRPEVPWSLVTNSTINASVPSVPEPGLPLRYVLDVSAMVRGTAEGPELSTYWRWSDLLTTEEEAAELIALWDDAVAAVAMAL